MSTPLTPKAKDAEELDTFLETLIADPMYMSFQHRVVSLERQIKAQTSPEVRKLVTDLVNGYDEWRRWYLEQYQAQADGNKA